MSVGEKMTAICNKIRSLLGLSALMGLDAMATHLDTAMTAVANAYAAVGAKGGTIPEAQTATNLPAAVDSIVLGNDGVIVQRKTGTLTTNFQGSATVTCGFKPDAVFLIANSANYPGSVHSGVAFSEKNVTSKNTLVCGSSNAYPFANYTLNQSATGFSLSGKRYDTSFQESADSNRTIEYVAIKYS